MTLTDPVIGHQYRFITDYDFSDDRVMRELLPCGRLVMVQVGTLAGINTDDRGCTVYTLSRGTKVFQGVRRLFDNSADCARERERIICKYTCEEVPSHENAAAQG